MGSYTHEMTPSHPEAISREALIECLDRTAQNFNAAPPGREALRETDEAYESIDALFFARPEIALEIARSEAAYGNVYLTDEEAIKLLLDVFMERNETKEE